MSTSEDEYDAQVGGAIGELSAEDCAKIDALSVDVSVAPSNTLCKPPKHLDVELEVPQTSKCEEMTTIRLPVTTPFQRYRPMGRLCEVQFEYGLQQYRSKRLDKRPESFITREGKEIRVEKETAQRNDVVLREGHAIHTALEREIHPPQVSIRVQTLEEEWGLRYDYFSTALVKSGFHSLLRLINMLNDIQTLMLLGKCREFPVVGFIHNHLVIGIDEINRIPLVAEQDSEQRKRPNNSVPSTRRKTKSKHTNGAEISSPDKQLKLSSFFPITPKKQWLTPVLNDHETKTSPPSITERLEASTKVPVPGSRRTHTLHLVDSKTRLSASLPQHAATLPSRLQLMVYKRLLDALLSTSSYFDFDHLWQHIGLDPQRSFSDTFLEEASLLNVLDKSICLKDLESRWKTAIHHLGVNEWEGHERADINPPVNDQLTLVYRLRAAGPKDRRKHKSRSRPVLSSEDQDLQRALEESLRYTPGPKDECSEMQHSTIVEQEPCTPGPPDQGVIATTNEPARIEEDSHSGGTLDSQLEWAIRESLREAANLPQATASNKVNADLPSCRMSSGRQTGDIIGQKRFTYDDVMLDAHLTNILQWWHGERDPRGVTVEESSRCYTCEYMSGCEWREKKAREALEQAKAAKKLAL
ncbi:exonuclease V a 5' deoxyribonuclease-domain-containing protein [Gautieria morchelliformis]|nr:exonuclease V a 5' deoxyribonuclease-domain-containing protein [Gautieria morchelliformis]